MNTLQMMVIFWPLSLIAGGFAIRWLGETIEKNAEQLEKSAWGRRLRDHGRMIRQTAPAFFYFAVLGAVIFGMLVVLDSQGAFG